LSALSIMWRVSHILSTWLATRLGVSASRGRFRGFDLEAMLVHKVWGRGSLEALDAYQGVDIIARYREVRTSR
jgi:hypothetical protein